MSLNFNNNDVFIEIATSSDAYNYDSYPEDNTESYDDETTTVLPTTFPSSTVLKTFSWTTVETSTDPSTVTFQSFVSPVKTYPPRRIPQTISTKSSQKSSSKPNQPNRFRTGGEKFKQKSYQGRKRQQEKIRKLAKRRLQRIKAKMQKQRLNNKTTRKINKNILNYF